MRFKRRAKEEVNVNLTPLIDVVFLLLIFFMVSTTFTRETELAVDLPEASGAPQQLDDTVVEIVISRAGDYSINGQALVNTKLATVKTAINQVAQNNNQIPIIVTADALAPHQAVVKAMDAAGQLGFNKLSITTKEPVDTES